MATLSKAYEAMVTNALGLVPAGLSTVISPLSAEERDRFTLAWLYASEEQRDQPATTWVLPEEDREAFERFRLGMNALSLT